MGSFLLENQLIIYRTQQNNMAYSSYKETKNPFISQIVEKWNSFIIFNGDTFIEKIVSSLAQLIVLILLVMLIPIGVIISIYNSIYNLQKGAMDRLNKKTDSSARFAVSIEFAIYFILGLPFFLVLIPYWVISSIIIWLANHKVFAIILIILIILGLVFKNQIIDFFPKTDSSLPNIVNPANLNSSSDTIVSDAFSIEQ